MLSLWTVFLRKRETSHASSAEISPDSYLSSEGLEPAARRQRDSMAPLVFGLEPPTPSVAATSSEGPTPPNPPLTTWGPDAPPHPPRVGGSPTDKPEDCRDFEKCGLAPAIFWWALRDSNPPTRRTQSRPPQGDTSP